MSEPNVTKQEASQQPAVSSHKNTERGFTIAEKWVIWAVFCLLVGLSSDFFIFPALLLFSYALVIFRRALITKKYLPALWLASGAAIAGGILIWWAIVS